MATKMKHTRAPWKVSYVPGKFEGYVYASSNIIAEIDRRAAVANTKAQQRTEADLRLISAAPDLLAACLALKKAGPLGQVEWNAAADLMDAAIAKAVG